jgi:hypothetical protein
MKSHACNLARVCPRRAGLAILAIAIVSAVGLAPAYGTTVTFIGSDLSGRSAEADFTFDGSGNLAIRLLNTAGSTAADPAYVLTGVFFNMTGSPALTSLSAVLSPGSQTIVDNVAGAQPAGGVVGGEWAFESGFTFRGAHDGISSTGLGIFGSNTFPGGILPGGHTVNDAVDGLDYGIVGAGGTANQGGLNGTPFIQGGVDFLLGGAPVGYEPTIDQVFFQYGTAVDEPYVPGEPPGFGEPPGSVPEPVTLLAIGSAMAGLARYINKRGKMPRHLATPGSGSL